MVPPCHSAWRIRPFRSINRKCLLPCATTSSTVLFSFGEKVAMIYANSILVNLLHNDMNN